MTRPTSDLTEGKVRAVIACYGGYIVNPWRLPRQHNELLQDLVKRGVLDRYWGRKHRVEYRLRKA